MQGPFQSDGAKIVLYFVSPWCTTIVEAGGKNFVFLCARAQENAFLDTFSPNFVYMPLFLVQQKSGGAWPPDPLLWLRCLWDGDIRLCRIFFPVFVENQSSPPRKQLIRACNMKTVEIFGILQLGSTFLSSQIVPKTIAMTCFK